jgi:hypothetical protein
MESFTSRKAGLANPSRSVRSWDDHLRERTPSHRNWPQMTITVSEFSKQPVELRFPPANKGTRAEARDYRLKEDTGSDPRAYFGFLTS